MGQVLRLPAAEINQSLEGLMADLLGACRRRTGETPERFADRVNKLSPRRPGLTGGHIRAAEKGVHPLPADLMAHAVTLAGIDAAWVLGGLLMTLAG